MSLCNTTEQRQTAKRGFKVNSLFIAAQPPLVDSPFFFSFSLPLATKTSHSSIGARGQRLKLQLCTPAYPDVEEWRS